MIQLKKELWEFLFNSIDEGFCIIEMIFDKHKKPIDYRFLLVNSSFEKQTGLIDAVGKRMREFAPNHEEHWFETYGEIALSGTSKRFENRAEQLHRWYDVYAFPFGDPEQYQVAILFNDITTRKQSEETIRMLNKELESFAYSVSHDLRAPLRAIIGYSSMLSKNLNQNNSPETERLIDIILKNAHKMEILIQDLLNFSRLGRDEIKKNNVDIENMVQTIIEDFCTESSVERSVFKIKTLFPANVDHSMIKQVWINLISNAYKYSRNSTSPSIEISSSQNDKEIKYSIRDNGVGFDMRYYNQLFQIFQRLHSESEFEGTGVGLAIVQRIVSRHGGKVWAESKLNRGTVFHFTIPI